MRKSDGAFRAAVCLAIWMTIAAPALVWAADMGHGGGQDMMMGDRVFTGKIGPWNGEARIVDMKAGMEASGMKGHGPMKNSHHLSFALSDPKTKAPLAAGKGSVTVTGPGKAKATSPLMVMQGHFGADVDLPKPGKYAFDVEIESGGKKGTAAFSHTLK